MPFLLLLLLVAAPAAAQTTCPTGTVFVQGSGAQSGDVRLPSMQGYCRRQAITLPGGQAVRPPTRATDSTSAPGFTR